MDAHTAAAETATWLLDREARALLTRLARVKPFALSETMVPAAAVSVSAQSAIERYLARGRAELRARVHDFIRWLHGAEGRAAAPDLAYRRFTFLRLRFNVVLSHFDVFSEVLTQRSEHETGVFLSGLDVVAEDALAVPGMPFAAPPVICYLQRGAGAAIRRARTRLPGGGQTPVAIVQMPRERMIGSGIASSLVHEVGHQGAALLDLVESLHPVLQREAAHAGPLANAWQLLDRWVSEIVADLWSVARIGVGSTLGLIAVVSLPRAFVFRINADDPHPTPFVRVKLSCAMGRALYPDAQWDRLAALWDAVYPRATLDPATRAVIEALEAAIPRFVALLLAHRPRALGGRSLGAALSAAERAPGGLRALYARWQRLPLEMRSAPPTLVFAAVGQAKADDRVTPEEENRLLAYLLTYWAMRSTLDASAVCADARRGARARRAHDAGAGRALAFTA